MGVKINDNINVTSELIPSYEIKEGRDQRAQRAFPKQPI